MSEKKGFVGKTVDIAYELWRILLAPKDEISFDEEFKARTFQTFLQRKGISNFLLYRSYIKHKNEEFGIYRMAGNKKGIIFEVFPSSFHSAAIEDSVFSLIETLSLYKGAVLFFSTFASRNIQDQLNEFKQLHQSNSNIDNPEILKEIINDHYNFLKEGTNKSIDNIYDLRVRKFVSTISILFPEGVEDKEILLLAQQIKGNLKSLHPINFPGMKLVRMLKEMINPDDTMESWNDTFDRHRYINKQVVKSSSSINTTKENSSNIKFGENWKYKVITTKQFPDKRTIVDSFEFYDIFFDRFRDNMQQPIPCPFYVSLVVDIGDTEKAKEKAINKSIDDREKTKKLNSSVVETNTDLKNRKEESIRNIELIEQFRQTPLDSMFQVTLMEEDEDKLEKYYKILQDRFSSKNWMVEEEKFLNVGLFVFLFSLPLQYHTKVKKHLDRFDLLFTSNNGAIAPLFGNYSNHDLVVCYLNGDGTLTGYDNFNGDNYNEAKTGASGGGKSFSQNYTHLMKLSAGHKIRVIDNGKSYIRLCQMLGGTFIDVGGDKSISLNFFTKAKTKTEISDNGVEKDILIDDGNGNLRKVLHEDEIEGIVPIIGLMIGLNLIKSGKEQSAEDATDEAFLANKIAQAVNEAFIRHQHDTKLEDVRKIIFEYHLEEKEFKNEKQASLLKSAFDGLYQFADKQGAHYIKYNTPNNINLEKDYVVLETLGLKGLILDVVVVSIAMIVANEFWKSGVHQKKSLDIDEAWKYKDNQIVVGILEENARTLRKYMASQSFITQGIEDFNSNKSMVALFGSSFHKILLSQDQKTIAKIEKGSFFPLSPLESRMYKSVANKAPHWGEMLYQSKNLMNVFLLKASPKMFWFIASADPNGNVKFNRIKEKFNLTDLETIKFLGEQTQNPELDEIEILKKAKSIQVETLTKDEEYSYWEKEIKEAIKHNKINAVAEPIIDIETKKIIAYEIFSNMEHSDGTISSFGKMIKWIDMFDLRAEVFEQSIIKAFTYFEQSDFALHINISSNDLYNVKILDKLEELILSFGMKNRVVIELKETDRNNNIEDLKNFIRRFKNIGVKIALDNVGNHYHKQSYLMILDIDYIKLEGSFIQEALQESLQETENKNALFSLELIMNIAKLGIKEQKVIATRIETEKDVEFLKSNNIAFCQGWLFSAENINITHL